MSSLLRAPAGTERQILVCVDRAVGIGEGELRYQLKHKDKHPLAYEDELCDVLDELAGRCQRAAGAPRRRVGTARRYLSPG
jgi:hypothetical protein